MSIKVIAGDILKGQWSFRSGSLHRWPEQDVILDNHIAMIEAITERNKAAIAERTGWATLGAVLFGPLGAAVGFLSGGVKKAIIFACELDDGRRFIAETDPLTWAELIVSDHAGQQSHKDDIPATVREQWARITDDPEKLKRLEDRYRAFWKGK